MLVDVGSAWWWWWWLLLDVVCCFWLLLLRAVVVLVSVDVGGGCGWLLVVGCGCGYGCCRLSIVTCCLLLLMTMILFLTLFFLSVHWLCLSSPCAFVSVFASEFVLVSAWDSE